MSYLLREVHSEPEYDTWFTVEEAADGNLMNFFHMEVFYWSPAVMRKAIAQWRVFRKHVPQVFFCHGEVDDDKFSRFISHFGFKYLDTIPCTDGKTRRLFITGD